MNPVVPPADHRIVSLVLLILGAVLVFGTGLMRLRAVAAPEGPGMLIAESPDIEWRDSPENDESPPKQADVKFVLRNPGGTTVHVVSVESGCGCARPIVRPSMIEPGGSGVVEVHANLPLMGEKIVPIVLHTDSPQTPQVSLQLRLKGVRRPPFLLQSIGDLTYLGYDFEGETSEIVALTVEPPGPRNLAPSCETDLPFLAIDPPTVTEGERTDSDAVTRRYTYRVHFIGPTPDADFSGEIRVVDPWDRGRVLRVSVHGRPRPEVRVTPSSIRLDPAVTAESSSRASFLVVTREPAPDLRVEPEEGEDSPLAVERTSVDSSGRVSQFAVRWKPGVRVAEGSHRLLVRAEPGESKAISVQIHVGGRRP